MRIRNFLRTLAVVIAAVLCLSATEQKGIVKFGGLPVPGATVTASQGDKKVIAVTDQEGKYVLPNLADGDWAVEIEMQGFQTLKQEVKVVAGAEPLEFEIKMMAFDQIKSIAVAPEPPPPATTTNTAPSGGLSASAVKPPDPKKNAKNAPQPNPNGNSGFQRTQANATANANAAPANNSAAPTSDAFAGQSPSDLSSRATDGLLVNGTTNNAASSPFALNSAFGNNRRGSRSLYNGNIGFTLDNSTFDARTFSITGQDTAKPTYNLFTGLASFGGPVKIPHVVRNGPNFFVNYQWLRNRNARLGTGLMPTDAERNGDFTGVAGLNGKLLALIDPATGQTIANNMIDPNRISTVARALLKLYPEPNFTGTAFNYQIPLVAPTHQDAMQTRWNKNASRKDQLNGGFGFQSTRSDTPSIFGFEDTSDGLGLQANINWRHSFTNRLSGTAGYQWSRQSNTTDPFFANRENISGAAGVQGNNQQPQNFGPPQLSFLSVAGLGDQNSSIIHNQTGALSYQMYWNRGRHNFQFGGDYKRQQFNSLAQSNPRGQFQFTGAASGNDFADFLLGVPDAASVAFGNADKYLRDNLWDAYFQDDWRISPGFTANLGVRWVYSSPMTELYGRLVNLDVASGFTAVAPVIGNNPIGPLTGIHYPNSLVNTDKHLIEPKIAISWRPLAASSLVVRAGYGIYENQSVYQSIVQQMVQQSPLSKSISLQNTTATPLTLANGFNATPLSTPNTFAVDPNFKVGYTHTWQVTIQRDLPFAMQMNVQYLGIKGVRAVQEFFPNTYPVGETSPCPTCPTGFAYMTSNGNSTREAGILQLRRRLHNGLQAQLQYTYSKSIDDAALGGNGGGGSVIAQNWLDLAGERGLSNFDQRHVVNITGQYTSGMGMGGGALVGGWRGALLKEWTILTNITIATGLPLNPIFPQLTQGTGGFGSVRPNYTGVSVYDAPPGLFLNPAAYTAPLPGEWGNAGRDSITGPSQFSLGASLGRTFRITDRYSLDFRLDSTNTLNHVTFPSWNTQVGSTQFGLPNTANGMRKIIARVTVRF